MAKETDLIRVSVETKKELDKLKPSHLQSITYDELIKILLRGFNVSFEEDKQENKEEKL